MNSFYLSWVFAFCFLLLSSSVSAQVPSVMVLQFESQSEQSSAELMQSKTVSILLQDPRFRTVDLLDVKKSLDLESQKALFDKECNKDKCFAELASAYGADYVVHGKLGKIGTRSVLAMQLFDAKKGKSVGRVDKDSDDTGLLFAELEAICGELMGAEFGDKVVVDVDEPGKGKGLLWVGGAMAAVGGAAALGSGIVLLSSNSILDNPETVTKEKDAAFFNAKISEVVLVGSVVVVLVGVGVLGYGLME